MLHLPHGVVRRKTRKYYSQWQAQSQKEQLCSSIFDKDTINGRNRIIAKDLFTLFSFTYKLLTMETREASNRIQQGCGLRIADNEKHIEFGDGCSNNSGIHISKDFHKCAIVGLWFGGRWQSRPATEANSEGFVSTHISNKVGGDQKYGYPCGVLVN